MIVNNSTNINKTQNIKKTVTYKMYGDGNQGPGLEQAQKYGGVKPANGI